jgi:hypothetical protein
VPPDPDLVQAVVADRLEPELRRAGMHVDAVTLFDYEDTTLVIVTALLGDLAFSPSVQSPADYVIDETLRTMEVAEDRGHARSRELFERLRRGEPLLGGGDE